MLNIEKGTGLRLGAWLDETGCQFCVWAPQAQRVELCLYDEQEVETARLVLPGRRGQYSFGHVHGIRAGQRYGYRVYGEPMDGLLFDGDKLLIDPYARAISRPLRWDADAYEGDSAAMQAKSVVVQDDFDWQGVTKPVISAQHTLVYEAHVKGFTKLHPAIPEAERGT
ncbi:glycogen debranching enzyme GlgX [Aeromonas molluscorum 848]|uniref:Glycogen debranching enzyme GlgX n=1 Tax=Aeromonas molluscorum 848 TaxID=1268236 RepID=R1H5Q6_9GAMM|nr:glycogen debranching enzyme GlgX [Aeromonas molluscorum 848]